MGKAAVLGVVGAFLIFYIMTAPSQAADIADGIWHVAVGAGHLIADIARGLRDFINKLAD